MQGAGQVINKPESLKNSAAVGAGTARENLPCAFERWTLLKQIARGGMGEVFLASTQGIEGAERPCVVKIIRREHAADKSFLARFLDEARIQAQLQHPGVAQILEAANDDRGKPYVVVEYVEGRNLAEVRARAGQLKLGIEWPDALALAVALGEALVHVHERTDPSGQPLAIVHRDLSPQNVMVAYAGDVKLIDFGTARGENRRCHTVSGIVFAKPGYVAPEVANNTPGGVPADLYAFGIMLWELLAGRRFLSGEAREHLAAVGAGERNPPELSNDLGIPAEIDQIVSRLTAPKIEERYASARLAIVDLLEVLKGAPNLADGERGVRARIARLMQRLYPAEPARSRAEFADLVSRARRAAARQRKTEPLTVPAAPSAPTESDPSILPGTRYRLTREVGRGGMGVVYEGVHIDLGRAVAIKILPREHANHSEFGERFRAEARAIASLQHENLVRLYDFGISQDGQPFYAMERLEGESMDVYLARESVLDWREAFRLGVQACRAVEAAHNAGVIHRDIKPANLFLTRTGVLKLLDFGVAKLMRSAEELDPDRSASSEALTGTPEYMAPEQISGGPIDERTDVYALGVVLYELVTGCLPHPAESLALLLDAKLGTPPERPGHRAPKRGLFPMVDDTLLRSLERDPSERFQSAGEMREALEAALREPEIQRRRRRRLGFAALGLLAIGIGAASAVAATRPDVRERAMAMVSPILERVPGLRGPANATGAALAAAKPAEPVAQPGKADPKAQDEAADDEPANGEPAESEATSESADNENDVEPEPRGAKGGGGDEAEAAPEKSASAPVAENAAPGDEADKTLDPASAAHKSAEPAAQPEKPAGENDKIQIAIDEAQKLIEGGKRIKGLGLLRRLGHNHYKEPRALKAWSEAAARVKAWGEAVRVAKHWASIDKSADARLQLARMQRAVGQRDEAIRTLARLTKEDPANEEAQNLLKSYSGDGRVAMRH